MSNKALYTTRQKYGQELARPYDLGWKDRVMVADYHEETDRVDALLVHSIRQAERDRYAARGLYRHW